MTEGKVLAGRYRMIRSLGEGGMGKVFLVRDRLNPRRRTALKLIREELSPRSLALFRKEFLTLARLSHPHLQRARDFRRFDGRCWFTYDFIPGSDLAAWSRGKPVSAIVPLLFQALDVLRFLHAHGVLHLDLKPSNLIVGERRRRPWLTLIDLGIHRRQRSARAPGLGTAPFAAPEVVMGKRPDARSDLYSLGVTFGEVLKEAGKRPGGPGIEAFPAAREVIRQLTRPDPAGRPPSAADVERILRDTVPGSSLLSGAGATALRFHGAGSLVGRREALASVLEAFRRARRGRWSEGMVLVIGEAGAGKTRFLREASGRIQVAGGTWVEAACQTGRPPESPLRDLSMQILAALGEDSRTARAFDRVFRTSAPVPESSSPFGSRRRPLAFEIERWSRFFEAASRERPLAIVVEELHRADRLTLDVLACLARALSRPARSSGEMAPPPLLLLGTIRPEELPRPPLDAPIHDLLRPQRARLITLAPFDLPETEEFLRLCLDGRRSPAGLSASLQAWTGGNPLFLEEMVRAMLSRGALLESGGRLHLTMPVESLTLPRTLSEVLERRLARLSGNERAALKRLSFMSRPFSPAEVPEGWPPRGSDARSWLESLVELALLERRGQARALYSIRYPGLAEKLRRSASPRAARRIHAQIASALDAAGVSPPEELAHHLLSAGDRARGIDAARRAMGDLERRHEPEALRWLHEKAIRLLERRSPDRVALQESLAAVLERAGLHREAEKVLLSCLKETEGIAVRKRGAGGRGRLLRKLAGLASNQGAHRKTMGYLSRARAALPAEPHSGLEGLRLAHEEARALLLAGRLDEADRKARANLEEVKRLRRSWTAGRLGGLEEIEPAVLNQLGAIQSALCRFDAAYRFYSRSLERLKRGPAGIMQAGLLCNLGNLATVTDRHGRARAHYLRGLKIACRLGALDLQSLLHGNLAVEAIVGWDLDEAAAQVETAKALAERAGARRHLSFALLLEGAIRTRLGELKAALEVFEEVRENAAADADPYIGMNASLQGAYPALFLGRLDRARHLAVEGTRSARQLGWARGILEGKLALGIIYLHAGSPAEARAELASALEAKEGRNVILDDELRFFHGRALRALGEMESSRREIAAALEGYRARRAGPMALEARLSLDRIEALAGRTPRPPASLVEAARGPLPPAIRLFVILEAAKVILALGESAKARGEPPAFDALRDMNAILAEGRSLAKRMESAHLGWRVLALKGRTARLLGAEGRAREFFASARRMAGTALQGLSAEMRSRYQRAEAWTSLHAGAAGAPIGETPADGLPATAALRIDGLERSLRAALEENSRLRERMEDLERRSRSAATPAPGPRGRQKTGELPGRAAAFSPLLGTSAAVRSVLRLIDRVAESDLPVLLIGENGTGKGAAAAAIHRAGRRSMGPFIEESCASIPEALVESEMFGHLSGAFTGACGDRPGRLRQAQGGTLFLSDISDIPLAIQRKLLPALRSKRIRPVGGTDEVEIDLRLVSSIRRPPAEEIGAGKLLRELHATISTIEVRLPPLRERLEDLPILVHAFLDDERRRSGREVKIDEETIDKLRLHSWPGNARELENVLRKLVVLGGDRIRAADFEPPAPAFAPPPAPGTASTLGYREAQQALDRQFLLEALEKSEGNISGAAKILGLNRRSIYKKLRRHGISIRRR